MMSKQIRDYFAEFDKQVGRSFVVANNARKKGYDPEEKAEILVAENMAERVESLISTIFPKIKNSGLIKRIGELENEYGLQDWRVAFIIALEVAQKKFCEFEDKKQAIEIGLRVGLAYITNGIVSSPLEGFTRLELKKTKKGEDYFALYFSGPIRSAGTTAVCVFVALCDYVRSKTGYSAYDASDEESKRMITELRDFHERVTNLQYFPSEDEIEFLVKNLPVQIEGESTEKYEVSNYKDLERVEGNVLSNGRCLVMGEGLAQKAAKFWGKFSKWNKDFDMKHWDFLEKFVKLQKKIKAKGEKAEESKDKIRPDYTFIKDLVAGRPVFTHPLAKGGFRLRYGRCRTSGLSAQAIHPATMVVLNGFIASGTQLKVERPGKASTYMSCDSIEGPIVKLNNGSVVFLENEEMAKKYVKNIEEILYLGDVLINYGDFFDRAHVLVPCGYNEEWWMAETGIDKREVDVDEAIKLCNENKIPLHPHYVFHWKDINKKQFKSLIEWLKKGKLDEEKVVLPYIYDIDLELSDEDPKRALEILGVPHRVVAKEHVVIENEWAKAFLFSIGGTSVFNINLDDFPNVLSVVNKLSGVKIHDKSGVFIGGRMGRPEKSKMRKMTGSPQVLFPVGKEGGRLRCFQSALDKGFVRGQFPLRYCENCKLETIYSNCEVCGNKTKQNNYCRLCGSSDCNNPVHDKLNYKTKKIDIKHYFDCALKKLGTRHYPELIKGVRGTSNKDHVPENLVKGILRAKYGLYVNKDGTIRYDMTEMPITHFKPKEIRISLSKLKELGYNEDIYGNELKKRDQILELKPQDIILPSCPDTLDDKADETLFKISKFIDEELEKLYDLEGFYNLENEDDLIGQLVIAMSPHTCAGIVGRIIGFSELQGLLAHPYFHCFMRRDCDGDEAGIMLLMDALLNFSRKYLPAHRGANQDEPLVLTTRLIPSEVDDMVYNMDIVDKYPLEFYEAASEFKMPWDVKIKKVNDVLGKKEQYEGFMFTHDVEDINNCVKCSAYKRLPTMQEKVNGQMEIAEKLRAVDEMDVARLVIERHFVRDIKGNLRKFSMQQFRCVSCNEKYRRPPLLGKCVKCDGKLLFTIAQGSVVKYLQSSLDLAKKYKLPAYLQQTLQLTKARIESVFGKEKEKQQGLGEFIK